MRLIRFWSGAGGDRLGGSEGGDGDVMLVMSVTGVWRYLGIVADVGVASEMRVWNGNSCIRGGSSPDDD